jgi:D-3-phosphoglycerate dehydrogenase / 2-oxoglutarate reductase
MKKVYFLDTVHEILAQRLSAAGYSCIDISNETYKSCCALIADAHGIVIRSRFPMAEALLRFAPELEFIARSGAGMENIDESYCADRGIVLFNAPEGNRNAVGEQALGMLLDLMNRITISNNEVRRGIWSREGNRGNELDGKTVGIIGYGNNGSAFARKLRGFDVKVLACDKYKTGFGTDFVMEATLEALLTKSDVVSFHIPQNKETLWFAGQEFFDALGKPVWLLNLSRGKIVHTKSLIAAIEAGKVLGAGLDVNEFEKSSFESFFEEDMPEELKYLIASEKVLLTPHIGGWTHESYFKLSDVLADKILDHYDGNDL